MAARVQAELARLTPRERVAFTLRHFEGLSIRDAAGVMGRTEGQVKQDVFRAVRKLRAALGTELEPTR